MKRQQEEQTKKSQGIAGKEAQRKRDYLLEKAIPCKEGSCSVGTTDTIHQENASLKGTKQK